MTTRAPSVLSISYDESLLRTRERILKAAGFDVTSALGFTEASAHCGKSSFDLVIIGHSLPRTDKAALVQEIRRTITPESSGCAGKVRSRSQALTTPSIPSLSTS